MMEGDGCAVIGAMEQVEMVAVFIAQVQVIVTVDPGAFFVKAQERMNAFHVAEEVIRTAITATALAS